MTPEQALAYFTPNLDTNGPVILTPSKMREAMADIQAALRPLDERQSPRKEQAP